jgi:hypothetical protein
MYEYDIDDENQDVMRRLADEIRRNPIPLTYRGQNVYDKKTNELLNIWLVDIVEKAGKGLWKPIFEFDGERKTQAASVTRKFLERGKSKEYPEGFPTELLFTKVKKGKNLRGFPSLTAKIDEAILELKTILPPYMRRNGNPQKPAKKDKSAPKKKSKRTKSDDQEEESDQEVEQNNEEMTDAASEEERIPESDQESEEDIVIKSMPKTKTTAKSKPKRKSTNGPAPRKHVTHKKAKSCLRTKNGMKMMRKTLSIPKKINLYILNQKNCFIVYLYVQNLVFVI